MNEKKDGAYPTDDRRIVSLFFSRDEQAILACQHKYGAYVHSVLYGILRNHEDSEECVNDVWMAVWNSIPPARPLHLKNYIAGIARNKGFNRYHYGKAQKRNGHTEELLEEIALFTPENDPAKELETKELKQAVNDFLATLDEETRVCFVLRYFYALSNDEISKKVGKSSHAVSALLSRTRMRLKNHLEKCHHL